MRLFTLVRKDPARACLFALVVANLVLVWVLPVLTGQDLPQHLSYARILADYADPGLPFRETFVLPEHTQPYFTAYLLLAPLARVASVLTALRLVYSVYVVAMAWGFSSLVRAVHARDGAMPWTCVLGALLAWNPVQCVGFLPFMLGLPAILFGAAAIVRVTRDGGRRAMLSLAVSAAAAASLHFVSAACLVAFALVHACCRPGKRATLAAVVTVAASIATVAVWRVAGEPGLAAFPTDLLSEQVALFGWWDGVVQTFGVQWTTPEEKAKYVFATVLGPLPLRAKMTVMVAALSLALVVFSSRRQAPPGHHNRTRFAYGVAVLAFGALTVATPSAIRLPDDICLLDFRLYVLLFMFALALVDPRWFEPLRGRVAIMGFSASVFVVWAYQLHGVATEAATVLHIVSPLGPRDTLLALPFHDRSEYLDESNSVTHYFPVYHTALHGGVTSLFWGKFSHHLPIAYRVGHEPPHPPDWGPGQFKRSDLLAATHVLVEWPDDDDGDNRLAGAARLRDELADGFLGMGCEGRWCLYRVEPDVTEEALR